MAEHPSGSEWTRKELRTLDRMRTPCAIQEFLESIPYCGDSNYRCPRSVLRLRTGHCYDGAVFAAAALRRLGYPPVILELIPNRRDDDHIIALFKERGAWGAVAKSNFSGLRYREPVYRSVRELVMSYFEGYFNLMKERTLRAYGMPLRLDRFDKWKWEMEDSAMDRVADALGKQRKYPEMTRAMVRNLTRVDTRSLLAAKLGMNVEATFKIDKPER